HGALRPGLGKDVVGDGTGVVDGLRVRHAADGGEAAGRRGAGAGLHGLLVLVAGLAEVDVNVDQAGTHDLAGRVEDLGALPGGPLDVPAGLRDQPVLHQHVLDGVDAVRRIDHATVPDEELHSPCPRSA